MVIQSDFLQPRPPINFDGLLIDIGSTPHFLLGLVDMDRVIPAKPVHHFLEDPLDLPLMQHFKNLRS